MKIGVRRITVLWFVSLAVLFIFKGNSNPNDWEIYWKFIGQIWSSLWLLFPIAAFLSIVATAFLSLFALLAGKVSLCLALLAALVLDVLIMLIMLGLAGEALEKLKFCYKYPAKK